VPTYEYQCTKCETVFELWQNVGDAPPPCPECAATEVKKVFHPPRVHFKGSGFYLTDLRAEKEKASSSAAAKSDAAKSDAAKSDAAQSDAGKPEAAKADNATETKADSKSDPAPAATPAKTETSAPKTDSASKPAST